MKENRLEIFFNFHGIYRSSIKRLRGLLNKICIFFIEIDLFYLGI